MMCCQIKLTWHDRDVVVGDGPLVVVFALVKINEAPGHPEIPSFVRIEALIKLLYPLRIGLPADADPFYGFLLHADKIAIHGIPLWQAFFYFLFSYFSDMP